MSKTDNYVMAGGTQLHYKTCGSGPYLLLLHGFTLSCEQWTEFLDEFSQHYTVLSFDLPGHGKSDILKESHSYVKWANLILTALKNLEINSVKAIGHSAGSITLLHMLEQQPELLESIILVSGTYRMSMKGKNMLLKDSFYNADVELQQYYKEIHGKDTLRINAIFRDINTMAEQVPTHINEVQSKYKALSKIKTPIFLVWGDEDPYFPMEIVLELYDKIPRKRLWVVPGQGHTPIWKEFGGDEKASELFPERAIGFFKENSLAKQP